MYLTQTSTLLDHVPNHATVVNSYLYMQIDILHVLNYGQPIYGSMNQFVPMPYIMDTN